MLSDFKKRSLQERVDRFSLQSTALLRQYSLKHRQRIASSEKEEIVRLRKQISNSNP